MPSSDKYRLGGINRHAGYAYVSITSRACRGKWDKAEKR